MARPATSLPALGPLETQVMELLWQKGQAPVRAVLESLNDAADRPRAYTTVMSVMHKLDRKGLLSRRRQGTTDIFRPRLSRHEYLDKRTRAEAARLIALYGDAAYVVFARAIARRERETMERTSKRRPNVTA